MCTKSTQRLLNINLHARSAEASRAYRSLLCLSSYIGNSAISFQVIALQDISQWNIIEFNISALTFIYFILGTVYQWLEIEFVLYFARANIELYII